MRRLLLSVLTISALVGLMAAAKFAAPPEKPLLADGVCLGGVHPRLSPDGKSIAVSYLGAVWTVPRAGGVMTRLTHGAGFDIEPVWSPDGGRIAYVNSPRFGTGELQIVTADGKNVPLKKRVEVLGTVLEFSIGQQQLGDTLKLDTPREVSVTAQAESHFPLAKVELVYNGSVVKELPLSDDKRTAKFDGPVRLDKSGWLSLRASGPGHADHPVGSLDAHTSPIYVQLTGSPSGAREDAAYFLKWIDRLSLALRLRDRVPNDTMRQHIQTQLESARTVYSRIAETGR